MLPAGVAELLTAHEVSTVKQAGFTGLDNGELIRRAIASGYEGLVTADRNLPAQQNMRAAGIAVVLVPGSRLRDIAPRAADLERVVGAAKPGRVTRLPRFT